MQTTNRFAALMITMTLGTSLLALPMGARASEEGKRNTTIVLGAVAAGLLLTQKNKLPGVVVAAGAAYAYTQYDASIQSRHEQDRYYGYDPNGYRYQDGQHADYRNHGDNRYGNSNDYRYGSSNGDHYGTNSGHEGRYQNGGNGGSYPNTYPNSNSHDGYRYGQDNYNGGLLTGGLSNDDNGRTARAQQNRTVRTAHAPRNTR